MGAQGRKSLDRILFGIGTFKSSQTGILDTRCGTVRSPYSSIEQEAEVPINSITSFNQKLLDSLKTSDKLLVCGQAMSHCVNYTLSSIVDRWDKDKYTNITLLTDCASSVPGFEEAGAKFQQDMSNLGVVLTTSSEVFD